MTERASAADFSRLYRTKRVVRVLGVLVALGLASMFAACSDESSTSAVSEEDAGDAGRRRGDGAIAVGDDDDEPTDGGGGGTKDAGTTKDVCAVTKDYVIGCGDTLTCGADKFDTWCKANDQAINSAAYRRAEALCLVPPKASCDGKQRRACEYAYYAKETPTAAQTQLVDAYCQTCDPQNVAACKTASTTFDTTKGVEAVPDIFVAAWELADPLVNDIRTTCTGASLDAGADCARAFATCAADLYIAKLPDCPP